MRGLIAVLYLMALGWAVSHYKLDEALAEAAHKALRGLMRESAEISFEVYEARYPQALQAMIISVPAIPPGAFDGR
jgi:hypothetical protein